MKNFGFKPSIIDGSEQVFSFTPGNNLPETYSFKKYLPDVLNQGNNPICVPCSISAYLNWRENLKDGGKKDNKINYFDIYNCKTTAGDGMTFKEAFYFLRHTGVKSNAGLLRINQYALISGPQALRQAILMNGPCVGAFPVYNYGADFWIDHGEKDYLMGYHAISIVGFEDDGFVIRNSWGKDFGISGYTKLLNRDFRQLKEIWTIID